MAETKRNGGKPSLKEDEVVARLVPDPAAPPDVVAMVGFLGKSTRPKYWRLYHTLDMKDYAEIAEGDIVQSQALKSERQTLGGTVIWVKSGARVQHTRSESRTDEAEFMQGEITRKFLSGTGVEGLARTGKNVILTGNTWYGHGACCSLGGCPVPIETRANICNLPD